MASAAANPERMAGQVRLADDADGEEALKSGRALKRLSSPERWEMKQLMASGAADYSDLNNFDEELGVLADVQELEEDEDVRAQVQIFRDAASGARVAAADTAGDDDDDDDVPEVPIECLLDELSLNRRVDPNGGGGGGGEEDEDEYEEDEEDEEMAD